MRHSRLIVALSIPLGFVLSHLAAYGVASAQPGEVEVVAHGYFGSLSGASVALALFGFLFAVMQGRRRHAFTVRASVLIGQLIAVYVSIEVVEHLSNGVPLGESLTRTTLLAGIAGQVAIGFALLWFLRAGHRLGELLSAPLTRTGERSSVLVLPVTQIVRAAVRRSSIRLRGPPAPLPARFL